MKDQLPSTLHELLAVAVAGARTLSRKRYLPHHVEWHFVNENHVCEICLTGAVIASRLNARPEIDYAPCDFPRSISNKLFAINRMRIGEWSRAFEFLYQKRPRADCSHPLKTLAIPHCSYFFGWEEFDTHLQSLLNIRPRLREAEQSMTISYLDTAPVIETYP